MTQKVESQDSKGLQRKYGLILNDIEVERKPAKKGWNRLQCCFPVILFFFFSLILSKRVGRRNLYSHSVQTRTPRRRA